MVDGLAGRRASKMICTKSLAARRVYPLLLNRRSSYVPGAAPAGIVNDRVPLAPPSVYSQVRYLVSSRVPAGYNPTQSLVVGLGMPLQEPVTFWARRLIVVAWRMTRRL